VEWREEELALKGRPWWREALDAGLWDAFEAGGAGGHCDDRLVQFAPVPHT
jgi:hypothetical protein